MVFSVGLPVAMVTYYVIIINASCSAIIDVSCGTITLPLTESVVESIHLIRIT